MQFKVVLTDLEGEGLRLLQFMAEANFRLHLRYPGLPLLYRSGIGYKRERDEVVMDYLAMLVNRVEDCDGLAAARAGELMAKGTHALTEEDDAWPLAERLWPARIPAEVMLLTRTPRRRQGQGAYHCIVRYWVGGIEFRDDPSLRVPQLERVV